MMNVKSDDKIEKEKEMTRALMKEEPKEEMDYYEEMDVDRREKWNQI